jgi:hypothetical protein
MNSRLVGCLVLAVLVIGAAADGADTEVSAETAKPAKNDKKKSFKPVMISRRTRNAVYPHRHDIQYADGGYAHVIHFPAPKRKPDNRVEALVGRPRVFGWVPARPKSFIEPLYNDEYDFINRRPVLYLPKSFFGRSSQKASALSTFGLPSFPPLPKSARRHLSTQLPSFPPLPSYTSQVVSHRRGKKNSYGVMEYPTFGAGPKANLQKLDFALDRLSTLNSKLREAEARVATARAASKRVDRQIAALTRIRANIRKMANQIADLEQKLGRSRSMQREIASITQFDPSTGIPSLGSDMLGEWLGDYITA